MLKMLVYKLSLFSRGDTKQALFLLWSPKKFRYKFIIFCLNSLL